MEELTQQQEDRKLEILTSLADWQDRPIESTESFNAVFSKHNGFQFVCYYTAPTRFNAYFGLTANQNGGEESVVHVVPQDRDDSDTAYNYVLTCPVGTLTLDLSPGMINAQEAIERIGRWDKYGESWMALKGDLLQAVAIPGHDFKQKENTLKAFFALKEVDTSADGNVVSEMEFDLILQYPGDPQLYLDTVHLIPPLKPGDTAYILSQIPHKIISEN